MYIVYILNVFDQLIMHKSCIKHTHNKYNIYIDSIINLDFLLDENNNYWFN